MLGGLAKSLFGSSNDRYVKSLNPTLAKIESFEPQLKAMADKKKNAGLFDNAMAQSVKDSAQQIWLAGMGAFAKAQAEGRQVFDALVREGSVLQKKTTDAAEQRLGEVTDRVQSMADDVQAKAGQRWDKLESIFEERTAKALARLGMPTAQEMH